MINTNISTLLTIKPVLQNLAQTDMPARESFKTLRILKVIDKEFENIETVQRNLFNTYGEKDEEGQLVINEDGTVKIKEEMIDKFNKEMFDFLNTELSLDIQKLKIEAFDNMPISPLLLMKMEDFIEE